MILFFLLVTDIFIFLVEEGDRIAQLVIEKIETPAVVEVDVCDVYSYLLYLTDAIHRTSRQPCAGQMGLAQREGMLLFDLLPKACCTVISRPCRMWLRPLLIIWASYLGNTSESACTTIYADEDNRTNEASRRTIKFQVGVELINCCLV